MRHANRYGAVACDTRWGCSTICRVVCCARGDDRRGPRKPSPGRCGTIPRVRSTPSTGQRLSARPARGKRPASNSPLSPRGSTRPTSCCSVRPGLSSPGSESGMTRGGWRRRSKRGPRPKTCPRRGREPPRYSLPWARSGQLGKPRRGLRWPPRTALSPSDWPPRYSRGRESRAARWILRGGAVTWGKSAGSRASCVSSIRAGFPSCPQCSPASPSPAGGRSTCSRRPCRTLLRATPIAPVTF